MDSRTRPSHAALHEKVFPHDDPIWEHIYPPNGFNCRCRVRTLSEDRLKEEGLSADSSKGQLRQEMVEAGDRKSTRLNSSHVAISYAVFCLKKKKHEERTRNT